jgi:hypothetical protein
VHPSSLENMIRCYRDYITPSFLDRRDRVALLDIGGADVNGSYRRVFREEKVHYVVADLAPAEGVDIVLDDPYHIPAADGAYDLVVSGQTFEHCEYFWLLFQEMVRVVKDDGFIFLIAPSSGPIHRYPVDCYRFYPDSYAALARYARCHLQECWLDERGPWNDLVGVFCKQPLQKDTRGASGAAAVPGPLAIWAPADLGDDVALGPAGEETRRGSEPYLTTLKQIHEVLRPESYLEIGVRAGDSLRLAKGHAIGVDPAMSPAVKETAAKETAAALYHTTSDEFFERHAQEALGRPVDFSFIDGLHLFEYVLRDFMNVERRASPCGCIVIDDIFPNHPAQSSRFRRTRAWCGDVWRLLPCLAEQRPDLLLLPLDCSPTGLLLIAGLDPANRQLWQEYNPIVRRYLSSDLTEVPAPILDRAGAVNPGASIVGDLLAGLRRLGEQGADAQQVRALCAEIRQRSRSRPSG